ncbi:zinc ribbon domain-containing protein [Cohnella sp. 56]|uniref:zinc ribbon domain-containing protein n=1 Tax=Cohnella sp. 56 TaxID=3113722 RepID=UPI0030E8CC98
MECPYCGAELERAGGRCPSCKRKLYEVTDEDFEEGGTGAAGSAAASGEALEAGDAAGMRELIVALEDRFVCAKCNHQGGLAREVAMTGAGLSKLLDVQHNHYLFVSCERCGYVEVFDPAVLLGKKPGGLGTLLDLLF